LPVPALDFLDPIADWDQRDRDNRVWIAVPDVMLRFVFEQRGLIGHRTVDARDPGLRAVAVA
jgi:hypothetical protein